MAIPTRRVADEYQIVLRKMRDRILRAREALDNASDVRAIEIAALDLRFALEDLLLSGLITHQEDLGAVTKKLLSADAADARKRVEKVNPNWWPNPQDLSQGGPPGITVTMNGHHDDDFMTADEWGRSFGTVSDLLHACNPFRRPHAGPHVKLKELQRIADRMWRLLQAHTLNTGAPGYLLIGRFVGDDVEVGVLTKTGEIPTEA